MKEMGSNWICYGKKALLAKKPALVYNLLRKVFGIEFPIALSSLKRIYGNSIYFGRWDAISFCYYDCLCKTADKRASNYWKIVSVFCSIVRINYNIQGIGVQWADGKFRFCRLLPVGKYSINEAKVRNNRPTACWWCTLVWWL